MKSLLIILCLFGLVCAQLPDYIKIEKCPRDVNELAKCIRHLINTLIPYFVKGIPELSIPSMDPFVLDYLNLTSGNNVGINIKGEATNIEARGIGSYHISNLTLNLDKGYLDVIVQIPKLTIAAEYVSRGTMLFKIPADSSGRFNAVFDNLRVRLIGYGKVIRNGELEYLKITKLILKTSIGKKSTLHVEPNAPDLNIKLLTALINSLPAKKVLKTMENPINIKALSIINERLRIFEQVPLQDFLLD